jgi:hypothetical protein
MPYEIDRHESFGGGIHRLVSPNNPEFPRDSFWDGYNMVYDRSSEDPEKMRGFSRLGTNTVNDIVSGLFDYSEGTKLIAASEDGGLYQRTTGDWSTATGGGAGTFSTTDGVRWSGTMFYGGTTTADLLILTNSASGDAPQKFVTSTVSALGGSPPAAGQFPTTFAGRLWMATGDTLHYSAADNAEDWATLGGSFQCDRGSGAITGLYNFAGNLLIFKRRKILRMLPGTSLASTSIRDLTAVIGAPNHHTTQETTGSYRAGSLFFMSYEGIHEIVPTSATGGFFVRNAADGIKPILDRRDTSNFDTDWATFNPARGEYYLQYTLNSAHPDEGVIGNVARGGGSSSKPPRWTTHDMRGKTAGTMYRSSGNLIQVIGDSAGRVFHMHQNDDRAGAGYRGFVTTASFSQMERFRMKIYGRVFCDLNTDGTYPIDVYTSLGRSGLPSPAGNTNQPSGFGSLDGWGTGLWGKALWGGVTVNGQWFRPARVRRGAFLRCRFETNGNDLWFRLNGLAIEHERRRRILAA